MQVLRLVSNLYRKVPKFIPALFLVTSVTYLSSECKENVNDSNVPIGNEEIVLEDSFRTHLYAYKKGKDVPFSLQAATMSTVNMLDSGTSSGTNSLACIVRAPIGI